MRVRTIVLLGLVHTALGSIASTKKDANTISAANTTVKLANTTQTVTNETKKLEAPNDLNILKLKTRRKKSIDRSTSSSSGDKGGGSKSKGSGSSLALSSSGSGGDTSRAEKYKKYENKEATGWRRWHRKCTPCPKDMVKKWRDPTIKWVCGGYQRARRSFKSECMMHYRNCQDGTMFVKIHSRRCPDAPAGGYARGRHFFYDYKVTLLDDSSSNTKSSSSSSSKESSSSEAY